MLARSPAVTTRRRRWYPAGNDPSARGCGTALFDESLKMIITQVEHDCPIPDEIVRRFQAVGEFCSVFFSATSTRAGGQDPSEVLASLLQQNELGEAVPKLLPFNLSAARHFAALNKYEFEGSLVGVLLDGTCTDRVVSDQAARRSRSPTPSLKAVTRPNGILVAYRMDDPSWSALTNSATLSWAYFVYETSRQLWWFVCFADPY